MNKFATDLNSFHIKACLNKTYFMYTCACVRVCIKFFGKWTFWISGLILSIDHINTFLYKM